MSLELAKQLYESGKAHASTSCLLYRASIEYAEDEHFEDPHAFAFNGTPSLSIHYLLGLGLELLLKSAIVMCDPDVDRANLQISIGHDLTKALDAAEARGFASNAQYLRDLTNLLRVPYRQHWFRYDRPDHMNLPGNFDQVAETLMVLDGELLAKLEAAVHPVC